MIVSVCVCVSVCTTVLDCLFFCPLTIGCTCATFLSSFSFRVCPLSICLCFCLSLASCLVLSPCMKYVCFMAAFVLTCRSTWAKCRGTYVFNLLANGKTWLNSACRMSHAAPKWRSMCRVSRVFNPPSTVATAKKLPSTITTTTTMQSSSSVKVEFGSPKSSTNYVCGVCCSQTAHKHTHAHSYTPMATTSIIRTVPPWEVTFALLAMHEQLRELASSVDTGLESHSTFHIQFPSVPSVVATFECVA